VLVVSRWGYRTFVTLKKAVVWALGGGRDVGCKFGPPAFGVGHRASLIHVITSQLSTFGDSWRILAHSTSTPSQLR